MPDDMTTPEPRSGDEPDRPHRRRRPRELWETETEPFPGALTLWDLEDTSADDAATILARYTVLRCMVAAAAGLGATFRYERRAARAYLEATPEPARRPLRRLLGRGGTVPAVLFRSLVEVGLHAAQCGHAGGAYTFLRWAYEVALAEHRRRLAARVAARLARLALEDDAPYSARRWTTRVHALIGDDGVPGSLDDVYVGGMNQRNDPPGGGYDAAARRTLAERIAAGGPTFCPVCNAPVSMTEVRAPKGVSYVRRRVWALCTGCRRTAAVDVPGRPVE